MSKRDVNVILKSILSEIMKLEKFTNGIDYETFVKDDMRYYAVIRCLEIIGEAVRQLPEDFKQKYSNIEWRKIVDLRNILIHEYFGIEPEIIWDIVKNKIPALKAFIKMLLGET
jgi:uncharacterized protein with HEPN domain